MVSLKERVERAGKRLSAMQEDYDLQIAGKPPKHNISTKDLKEMRAYKTFLDSLNGETKNAPTAMVNLKEMITSTDVIQMIPRVIEGQMIEAGEPELFVSSMFTKVQAPSSGVVVVVPIVGEIFAKEVGEAQPYDEDTFELTTMEKTSVTINIKKVGLKVSISEEALTDYTWDIYNMTIKKFGRAFARFREQRCMDEFSMHGHVVFNNALRDQKPAAGTHGLGKDGKINNTLSVEDFLDLMLVAITNHHNPTDFIAHPLIWSVFARNAMIGAGLTFGALGGQNVHPSGGTQGTPNNGFQNNMGPQQFIMTPDQISNRLPFALNVILTPQVKFDKEKKLFDCYVVDRNEIGVIAQREEITMSNWTNPDRDIMHVKARERYGVGIQDHGLGIMVARNIAVAPSYPESLPVHVIAD